MKEDIEQMSDGEVNGREAYAIVEINELERLKATINLLTKLEEGEQSAREKGWLIGAEMKGKNFSVDNPERI